MILVSVMTSLAVGPKFSKVYLFLIVVARSELGDSMIMPLGVGNYISRDIFDKLCKHHR